jgi:hypothetical protein
MPGAGGGERAARHGRSRRRRAGGQAWAVDGQARAGARRGRRSGRRPSLDKVVGGGAVAGEKGAGKF